MKHIAIFLLFSTYTINTSEKNSPIHFKQIEKNKKITAGLHNIESLCLGLGLIKILEVGYTPVFILPSREDKRINNIHLFIRGSIFASKNFCLAFIFLSTAKIINEYNKSS